MRELRPKRLVFNDLNPRVLHGRTLRNRQDGNVVRGMFAVAMLAIEKRLTVAVRYLLVERFKEDHAAVEPDYDLGEHQRVLDLDDGSAAADSADGGGPDRVVGSSELTSGRLLGDRDPPAAELGFEDGPVAA